MHKLRNLVNYIFPLRDFAYILQLEEYNVSRYWKQVYLRLYKRNFEQRDVLQYTDRIKLTCGVFLTVILLLAYVAYALDPILVIIWLLVLPLSTPYILGLCSLVVAIPVQLMSMRKLRRATDYFAKHYSDTKVIAVTGSFGKTTAKYLLQHVLQYDYKVAIIPDNLNTALGIADYILSDKLPNKPDILIVEMGAYTIGDIATSAAVTPPDYALLTILGDQHLERFGSQENLTVGKSEIFTTNQKTTCYTSEKSVQQIKGVEIATDQLLPVAIPEGKKTTKYLVKKLAIDLGVSEESINTSLDSFTLPDRRNNIIVRQGVIIIDNSYNISPMVAEAMLTEAAATAQSMNKKLVVMTGGIGEQGVNEAAVNKQLAELVNTHATRAILNPTVFVRHMEDVIHIPYETIYFRTDVTDNPAKYLNAEEEVLLWLTSHSDLAYL